MSYSDLFDESKKHIYLKYRLLQKVIATCSEAIWITPILIRIKEVFPEQNQKYY